MQETELSALDKWYLKQAAEKADGTSNGDKGPDLSTLESPADSVDIPDGPEILAMIDEAGIGTSADDADMAQIAAMPEAPEIAPSPGLRAKPHLSVEQRTSLGKQARKETPRSSHAGFVPAENRADPVSILEAQATERVPDLVPIRYGRMLVSPFTFYRGAAAIMAADLASTPTSGISVQLCGDAHLSNFGLFATPERQLVFDVNDFDETIPGPWEYDVKRLVTSVVIAGRDQEFTEDEVNVAALAAASGYREAMRTLAKSSTMDVWYSHIDAEALLASLRDAAKTTGSKVDKQMAEKTAKLISKAKTRDSLQALEKLTVVVDGERRIINDPPLVIPITDLFPEVESDAISEMLHGLIRRYRHSLQSDRRHLVESFELRDVARKVVGVGSVGTRAWILLLTGVNGDPLFLQAKEAMSSVLEPFVGRSNYANHAQRVVTGQHLMQASSDIFLGWERVDGLDGKTRDYYVRQLRDMKGSFTVEASVPDGLAKYANVCGQALARAHARSGDRIAISSYLGSGAAFDESIADFANAYADQNALDYAALQAARDTGRIEVTSGY